MSDLVTGAMQGCARILFAMNTGCGVVALLLGLVACGLFIWFFLVLTRVI